MQTAESSVFTFFIGKFFIYNFGPDSGPVSINFRMLLLEFKNVSFVWQ